MSYKPEPSENEVDPLVAADPELKTRREFLRGLGRWSAIIIGGAALGGIVESTDAAGWINGGGGAWVNARGGGGGWVNGGGGGASWVNRSGGWINGAGGGGGGAWVNARGGGGGAWVNRR
jgi:hypothetical protein